MSPHVLLINLDRSTERLVRCRAVLDGLGVAWERVAAIDGRDLDAEFLSRINPQPPPSAQWYRPLTPGEIGCFLSHLRCWRLILERQWDCALILEDDFAATSVCTAQALDVLAASHKQWDVLKLSCIGRDPMPVAALDAGLELCLRGRGPVDGTAYWVSNEGARKLVAERECVYRPVDFELKHHWERHLRLLAARPEMFGQIGHEQAPSIIGERTDYRSYPFLKKMGVYLRKHRYHARFWLADRLRLR